MQHSIRRYLRLLTSGNEDARVRDMIIITRSHEASAQQILHKKSYPLNKR